MATVKQLQAELKKKGLDTTGKKAELEARLEEANAAPKAKAAAPASKKRKAAEETPAPAKAAKVAMNGVGQKASAPKKGGKAAATDFRQDAYGKHETHTQCVARPHASPFSAGAPAAHPPILTHCGCAFRYCMQFFDKK